MFLHTITCISNLIIINAQVPLGAMLKNESVLGDMIDILDGLHRYTYDYNLPDIGCLYRGWTYKSC